MTVSSSKVHTFFLAIISSALTFVTLVLLVRLGHMHILISTVDHAHTEYPLTTGANCHCPPAKECAGPPPSRRLFPRIFEEAPFLKYQSKNAGQVDWESKLLTPNGGFLIVEEWDYEVKGYGVSMFHQLHCLTMMLVLPVAVACVLINIHSRTMLLGGEMSMSTPTARDKKTDDPMHDLHCLDYLAQV
jgi:hypothetical protein